MYCRVERQIPKVLIGIHNVQCIRIPAPAVNVMIEQPRFVIPIALRFQPQILLSLTIQSLAVYLVYPVPADTK